MTDGKYWRKLAAQVDVDWWFEVSRSEWAQLYNMQLLVGEFSSHFPDEIPFCPLLATWNVYVFCLERKTVYYLLFPIILGQFKSYARFVDQQ